MDVVEVVVVAEVVVVVLEEEAEDLRDEVVVVDDDVRFEARVAGVRAEAEIEDASDGDVSDDSNDVITSTNGVVVAAETSMSS